MRIEVEGTIWESDSNLPDYVKSERVAEMISQEIKARHRIPGLTLHCRYPAPFKPTENLFDGIIGFDRHGPIRKPDPVVRFTCISY